MKIVILKYNAGNIQSVSFALQRIGIHPVITNNKEDLLSADKIIFPGVGEASSAMQYLRNKKLDLLIKDLKQPVLGICLGMQLMCSYSPEGNTSCMKIFPDINLEKFTSLNNLKVPQIGWNSISFQNNVLFADLPNDAYAYNVHSYYIPISKYTIASCNYGIAYSAAIHNNNFYGVQFHPEKSGVIGEQILKNFIERIN